MLLELRQVDLRLVNLRLGLSRLETRVLECLDLAWDSGVVEVGLAVGVGGLAVVYVLYRPHVGFRGLGVSEYEYAWFES